MKDVPRFRSCLYRGLVTHRRLRPFRHRFAYRVFSLWLDLDELESLDRRLRLLSHNRPNLFSIHDRDHGPRDGSPLRPWIDALLAAAGLDGAGGKVWLLTFPRVLGYVFNPLSIWFCHHRDGRLIAILYEVSNTFGEHHSYLVPVPSDRRADGPVFQDCLKDFHVSPFIGMAATYRFRLREPDERLSILIRQSVTEGELLTVTLTGRRAALTDLNLLKCFFVYPLMTLKVIAAIYWEAFRLWRKGATFHDRRPPPPIPVTFVDFVARLDCPVPGEARSRNVHEEQRPSHEHA